MSVLTALARAEAVESGRAQPLTTVRHTHISARPLVLVPLSLAGEAAAPLAALVGSDEAAPRLLVVSNPRNRTQRFDFVAELATAVLSYVNSHLRTVEQVPGRSAKSAGSASANPAPAIARGARLRYAEAPQLLVPNSGGVEFLRLLGRSARFRRTYGPNAVHRTVPLLGQWLTFFRDRADHAGSAMLLAVTEVLGAHSGSTARPPPRWPRTRCGGRRPGRARIPRSTTRSWRRRSPPRGTSAVFATFPRYWPASSNPRGR